MSAKIVSFLFDRKPTLTEVRTSFPFTNFIFLEVVSVLDSISLALAVRELVVTLASRPSLVSHSPIFQTAKSEVFSQQDVESCVDRQSDVVANEDDSIEAFEYHTNLRGRKPLVSATLICVSEGQVCECSLTFADIRLVKTISSSAA